MDYRIDGEISNLRSQTSDINIAVVMALGVIAENVEELKWAINRQASALEEIANKVTAEEIAAALLALVTKK